MIPKDYTATRAHKISNRTVKNVTDPFSMRIFWVRVTSEDSRYMFTSYLHKHSFFEAHYTFQGEIEYEIDGVGIYRIAEGETLVIPPEVPHRVVIASPESFRISITFSVNTSCDQCVKMRFDDTVSEDFSAIFKEADNKDSLSDVLIRDKVLSVLSPYLRQTDAHPDTNDKKNESEFNGDIRVARAKRYINDNKGVFLDCNDVARYCHFNVKYLNRIFKNEVGETLLSYIHRVKIEEAKILLDDPSTSIDDISERLGFANVQYFSTFFKQRVGCSPAAYRKIRKI